MDEIDPGKALLLHSKKAGFKYCPSWADKIDTNFIFMEEVMRTQAKQIFSLVVHGSFLFLMACHTPSSSETEEQDPLDVESVYFNLSKEVQTEVLGTQVKSMSEMRKELLAQGDTDGDGQLSEDEKSALRAQWQEMKAQIMAEMKAALDTDQDGDVSPEEKRAGLDNIGQKIKAAIQSKHEEMHAAQEAAREKVRAACAQVRGQDAQLQKPEGTDKSDKVQAELDDCQTIAKEEREKLQTLLKDSLAALKQEVDELKSILATVESQNQTI